MYVCMSYVKQSSISVGLLRQQPFSIDQMQHRITNNAKHKKINFKNYYKMTETTSQPPSSSSVLQKDSSSITKVMEEKGAVESNSAGSGASGTALPEASGATLSTAPTTQTTTAVTTSTTTNNHSTSTAFVVAEGSSHSPSQMTVTSDDVNYLIYR